MTVITHNYSGPMFGYHNGITVAVLLGLWNVPCYNSQFRVDLDPGTLDPATFYKHAT